MSNISVLVDTSFLITLYDNTRDGSDVANKYFHYFLDHKMILYLSTVVISEFHQGQSIIDVLQSGNYVPLPYNLEDAIETATIAYHLGGKKRQPGRAEYKDDLKLMGQAKQNNIDYIITADENTLAKYCESLTKIGKSLFPPKMIRLKNGFDSGIFNNGQQSMIDNN